MNEGKGSPATFLYGKSVSSGRRRISNIQTYHPTPLYIDLHIDNSLTPDLIRKCHVADKRIQEKYGVRYLQILLNQPQGYLFCLVEGPDKESCARVHQEAHGNIACNILEITESDFSALLANKPKDSLDFTLNQDGTFDTGNRALLAVDLVAMPDNYRAARQMVMDVLRKYEGKSGESFENRLFGLFDSCSSAVEAGLVIGKVISGAGVPVEVRMGVDVGPPLKQQGNFFEDVCKTAEQFAFISRNGEVTISARVEQARHGDGKSRSASIRVIGPAEEKFLSQVMGCIHGIWNKGEITIEDFGRELAMSRSQLGRRLKSLAGLSPNDFIKEFRLRRAVEMMEGRCLNIAEITMAIGFTNPSYFAKCFRQRFGRAPSDFKVIA